MKKNIILIILFFYVVLVFAEDKEDRFTFKPHYQLYNDSVWLPNTTAYDFISAFSYNDNIYFALNGGIGKYNQDSLTVYPYPFYGKLKGSIRSVIQINSELWIAMQQDGIGIFDMNINSFIRKLEIEDESNFVRPFSNINMKYDKEYNTVWISTMNGLFSFDVNKDELTNWTGFIRDFNLGKILNFKALTICDDNVWVISRASTYSKGALLKYSKSLNEWTLLREELIGYENLKRLHIIGLITSPYYVWVYVSGGSGKLEGIISEYNKSDNSWTIYEPYELSEMIEKFINALPKVVSHTGSLPTGFPISYLEKLKRKYIIKQNEKKDSKFIKLNESIIDSLLNKLKSIQYIDFYTASRNYDYKYDFTFQNQLVFHDENGYIIAKKNYLDKIVEYHYPITQYKNEVILITNKGLSVLNLDNYSISNIKGMCEIGFAKGETKTLYIKIKNHIYLIFITYGHDREYFIYDYDMDNHIFKDITPDFKFHYKPEYFWESENKLYMFNRQNLEVFQFENDKWINVIEKNEQKIFFQSLPNELILDDGRKLLIDFSGLTIFN